MTLYRSESGQFVTRQLTNWTQMGRHRKNALRACSGDYCTIPGQDAGGVPLFATAAVRK